MVIYNLPTSYKVNRYNMARQDQLVKIVIVIKTTSKSVDNKLLKYKSNNFRRLNTKRWIPLNNCTDDNWEACWVSGLIWQINFSGSLWPCYHINIIPWFHENPSNVNGARKSFIWMWRLVLWFYVHIEAHNQLSVLLSTNNIIKITDSMTTSYSNTNYYEGN